MDLNNPKFLRMLRALFDHALNETNVSPRERNTILGILTHLERGRRDYDRMAEELGHERVNTMTNCGSRALVKALVNILRHLGHDIPYTLFGC